MTDWKTIQDDLRESELTYLELLMLLTKIACEEEAAVCISQEATDLADRYEYAAHVMRSLLEGEGFGSPPPYPKPEDFGQEG